MAPATDELIGRINAVDVGALEAAARALDAAAERMGDHARQVTGIVSATIPHWTGAGAGAWVDYFTRPTANLRMAVWPLHEMAAALRELAVEAERARSGIAGAQDEFRAIYMDPTDLGARLRAEALIQGAASSYHAAEQRIREKLWRIGDLAPYPLPAPAPPPPRPRPGSFWEALLAPPPPIYGWGLDQNHQPYGLDEDGNHVAPYRGDYLEFEVQEAGVGGLLRLIPRVAGRLPANPTFKQVAKAFADDIVKSRKWSSGAIRKHIEEWHGLPRSSSLTPQMEKDFLDMVSRAAASKTRVYDSFLEGRPTLAKLHRDPGTRKWLVVHFYKDTGEFASAFVPSKAAVDALLRQAATRG
jgi:uncharacterized protein YukE